MYGNFMQPWRQDGNMTAEILALRAKYLKFLKISSRYLLSLISVMREKRHPDRLFTEIYVYRKSDSNFTHFCYLH